MDGWAGGNADLSISVGGKLSQDMVMVMVAPPVSYQLVPLAGRGMRGCMMHC